jgi:predicted ABC-type ATPase
VKLDQRAYGAFLHLARARPTVLFKWDPDKHPRDLNGRWRNTPDFEDGKLSSVLDNKDPAKPSNTQDLHTWRNPDHGHRWEYTPERLELHEAIIESYLAGKEPVPEGETPKALFTAGGAGSGKTEGLNKLDIEPPDAVLVDPDDIKLLIPERQKLMDEGISYTTSLIHDESMDIAEKLRARILKDRYNAVMDGTGASQLFVDRIQNALDAKYEIEVAYFHVDVEEAYRRIEKRRAMTGRRVNKWVAWDQHRNASRRFHDVYELGVAFKVYDASEQDPRLVVDAEAGADPEIHDQTVFDAFLAKGDVPPAWEAEREERRRATKATKSTEPGPPAQLPIGTI